MYGAGDCRTASIMTDHACPVCGYDGDLTFRPREYQICACCGTEFGFDDRVLNYAQLRDEWLNKGCPWFDPDELKPVSWNAYGQLLTAGFVVGRLRQDERDR